MIIEVVDVDENEKEVSRRVIALEDVPSAARAGGWCWPAIEGESDSRPLPIAADILMDHLKDGDEALLYDIDGLPKVRLTPVRH